MPTSSTPSTFSAEDVLAFVAHDDVKACGPAADDLARILTSPVGHTSSGFPYLPEPSWVRFRDWVPHTFADGARTLSTSEALSDLAQTLSLPDDLKNNISEGHKVVRQVVMTAQVTAPPDCWLLFHVVRGLHAHGLCQRLLDGERLDPASCTGAHGKPLLAHELQTDLTFLLSRGLLLKTRKGYRLADHQGARDVMGLFDDDSAAAVVSLPSGLAEAWRQAFLDDSVDLQPLHDALARPLPQARRDAGRWQPTAHDVVLGARLVPLVLGLRAADRIPALLDAGRVDDDALGAVARDPALCQKVRDVLRASGGLDDDGAFTVTGRRVLERGPGPFGIIETYHPYLAQLPRILSEGRSAVWVERTANVAASQDANRKTFLRANDALDAFCEETGFTYNVFIEHALGKGEATRQRFERSPKLSFVGADLEDAAIDAAIGEQQQGHLPKDMAFVRSADIGKPHILLDGLQQANVESEGAVMMVGNGFHEVRGQTDDVMTEVFAGYERAGLLVLFTEETSLSVDDLLQTAFNTYHAGFKYVHQRSGQGLRPAVPRPPSVLEGRLPLSWTECAERAGYVRLDRFSSRSRTVYPYTPTSGHNPSISVTHFCVPKRIADKLGLT